MHILCSNTNALLSWRLRLPFGINTVLLIYINEDAWPSAQGVTFTIMSEIVVSIHGSIYFVPVHSAVNG